VIVDTGAYVISLVQVFIAFIIRDFLIPLFVWNKHLKGRTWGYRFWFCVITQAALQINLVLLLGILNICNRWTVIGSNLVVYLLIIWNYSDKKGLSRIKSFVGSLWSAYKEEMLFRYIWQSLTDWLKKMYRSISSWTIWEHFKQHWLEMILLAGIIIYNGWFFTHNVMHYHSYQASDIPVHQSWIYELEQGTLFPDGIYPFGMHAMIYFIRVIFGYNLREILLYAGSYQFIILILGVYFLAKEIFTGKYTPIAVILITSLMLNQGRYAASLPQEAGMFAVVGLAYFMLRYLHTNPQRFEIKGESKKRGLLWLNAYVNRRYISSEMLLLMLSVSLVINYHYYTAIAAAFLVIAIGLAYIPRIFRKQYFIPLMFSGLMGALIAITPIGLSLAKGIPFQGSIDWATTVMSGEEWHGSGEDYQDKLSATVGEESVENEESIESEEPISGVEPDTTVKDETNHSRMSVKAIIKYYYDSIFDFGVSAMHGREPTRWLFVCLGIGLLCALIMLLMKKTQNNGHDYLAMTLTMMILFTFGASGPLGIPELIQVGRISAFAQPLEGLIYVLPVDFIFCMMAYWKSRSWQTITRLLSLANCALVIILIINMGWYHDFFGVYQAYYNEPVYVLRNVKETYPIYSYTIVSPTDEYYDVIDHGRHTELSEFVNMVNGKQEKFYFTTDYVFFFIEKEVLKDYNYGKVRVAPEYAAKDFTFMRNILDYDYQRAVIQSQAYYWAKAFEQMYPRNFKVFYEDDIYVVYLMKQNTYSPYDLQIDYLKDYRDLLQSNSIISD